MKNWYKVAFEAKLSTEDIKLLSTKFYTILKTYLDVEDAAGLQFVDRELALEEKELTDEVTNSNECLEEGQEINKQLIVCSNDYQASDNFGLNVIQISNTVLQHVNMTAKYGEYVVISDIDLGASNIYRVIKINFDSIFLSLVAPVDMVPTTDSVNTIESDDEDLLLSYTDDKYLS